MLRIELGEEVKRRGRWAWSCAELGLSGVSHQPLLDACRAIKRMGGAPTQLAGLFRKGRSEADLSCVVGAGAGLTVREDQKIGPVFVKWRPFKR
jgi:hypothetical protein